MDMYCLGGPDAPTTPVKEVVVRAGAGTPDLDGTLPCIGMYWCKTL